LITTVHPAVTLQPSLVTRERYEGAVSFADHIGAAVKNRDWWHAAYRVARIDDDIVARARALSSFWRLLAVSEDWCGDAVNVLPYVARLAESSPNTLEMRVLNRDANIDIMNAHLTGHSRSIPVILALDSDFVEHGWWGPRPAELQQQATGEWWILPKDDRRVRIRTWYARDRGRQTLDEVLYLLETAEQRV
jgi:hypothetical protein